MDQTFKLSSVPGWKVHDDKNKQTNKKQIERWKLKLLGREYFEATFFYKTPETLRRKCEVLSATLMENLGPSNVHVLFILEIKNISSLAPKKKKKECLDVHKEVYSVFFETALNIYEQSCDIYLSPHYLPLSVLKFWHILQFHSLTLSYLGIVQMLMSLLQWGFQNRVSFRQSNQWKLSINLIVVLLLNMEFVLGGGEGYQILIFFSVYS